MGVARSPVVISAPRSRGARAYVALWDEVRDRLGLGVETTAGPAA
jgi:hypothetical protein